MIKWSVESFSDEEELTNREYVDSSRDILDRLQNVVMFL